MNIAMTLNLRPLMAMFLALMVLMSGASGLVAAEEDGYDLDEWSGETEFTIGDGENILLTEGQTETFEYSNLENGEVVSAHVSVELNDDDEYVEFVYLSENDVELENDSATFVIEHDEILDNEYELEEGDELLIRTVIDVEDGESFEMYGDELVVTVDYVDGFFAVSEEVVMNYDHIVSMDTATEGFLSILGLGDEVDTASISHEFVSDSDSLDLDDRTFVMTLNDEDVADAFASSAEDAEAGEWLTGHKMTVNGEDIKVYNGEPEETPDGSFATYDDGEVSLHIDNEEHDRQSLLVNYDSTGYSWFEALTFDFSFPFFG